MFYGIRGGGSNFGIVTVFTLKLYDQQPTVFAGPIVFTPDKCEQVASVLASWWEGAGEKEGLLAGMSPAPDGSVSFYLICKDHRDLLLISCPPILALHYLVLVFQWDRSHGTGDIQALL